MFNKKVYVNYDDVTGIDLQTARSDISFPIEMEKVQSVNSSKILNKSVLFNIQGGPNKNDRVPIGFVSDRRKIIPYGDMMDIITDELSNIVKFKLIESNIANKSYNVTQRYLLDHSIDNPDGQQLASMLIVNYSYIGLPLSLELGTFRYVCANGAVVKIEDFEKISIKMHDLNSLYIKNIGNVIRRGLDSITRVSDVYAKLASEDWTSYLIKLMNDRDTTVAFKKSVVDYLIMNKEMYPMTKNTIKNDVFTTLSLLGSNLVDEDGESIYSLNATKSAWQFYNDCTDVSTHSSPSVSMRTRNDLSVSHLFAV